MADFIKVDAREKTLNLRLAQRIRPVFDLRVAREEQLLSIHFKQQDQAGVVHHSVERSYNPQQLFAPDRSHALDKPARKWRCAQSRIGSCTTKYFRLGLE